jgi:hypothetical protein
MYIQDALIFLLQRIKKAKGITTVGESTVLGLRYSYSPAANYNNQYREPLSLQPQRYDNLVQSIHSL